jgi:hypothetical protein
MDFAVAAASYNPMLTNYSQQASNITSAQNMAPSNNGQTQANRLTLISQDGNAQKNATNLQQDPNKSNAATKSTLAREQQSAQSGFKFEFKDNVRVMEVHDNKGVLIYQVPPKGQLQLLQAEKKASKLDTTA